MIVGNVGAPVERRPHPGGRKGAIMSLDECARRAWKSRGDPLVRAWTTQQLKACGWPSGRRDQARCIVRAFRSQVRYVEDPLQVEAMYGPRQTLCLDKGGLCVVGADCDDTAITLGAAFMSVGWRVWIVGASYRDPSTPTHVYVAFEDDLGQPVRVDGTTAYDVGTVNPFAKEWWIDPAKGIAVDGQGVGEFVGVGHPASFQQVAFRRDVAGALEQLRAYVSTLSPHDRSVSGVALHLAHAEEAAATGDYVRAKSHLDAAAPMMAQLSAPMMLGGRAVDGFGLGFTTPGDVLLYRNMWNDYVIDTVRVSAACAQAYGSLAQNEQNAAAKAAEEQMSVSLQKTSDDLLALWNVYAGWSDDLIVGNGAQILKSYQDTVVTAGNVRATMAGDKCPMSYIDKNGQIVAPVDGPDKSLQVQVISRIEGLGILAGGVLEIIEATGAGAVKFVGTAAQWAGKQAEKAANILSTPWPYVAIAVVAGGVIVWRTWPKSR